METNEKPSVARAYAENLTIICGLVFRFFDDDRKTRLWLRTPNPMLGDVSPREMVLMGRYERLLRFITQALEE